MQPGWCQPVRQEFMENECEAVPGVAYPGVRDNRSTLNTKTGYDDDDDDCNYKKINNITCYKNQFLCHRHHRGFLVRLLQPRP